MKNAKYIWLCLILCIIATTGFAQKQSFKATQNFLQQNADSTLIFSLTSNWMRPLKYFVISKKSDTITLYKYWPIYERRIKMPKKMADTLSKLSNIPYDKMGGINADFQAVQASDKDLKKLWNTLMEQQPFTIADDKTDGEGCPVTNGWSDSISDGGGVELILITAKEIRTLSFYAPDFYHKICPGRKGRKAILEIQKLLTATFGKLY
jgi:hypothetical protein